MTLLTLPNDLDYGMYGDVICFAYRTKPSGSSILTAILPFLDSGKDKNKGKKPLTRSGTY